MSQSITTLTSLKQTQLSISRHTPQPLIVGTELYLYNGVVVCVEFVNDLEGMGVPEYDIGVFLRLTFAAAGYECS